MCDHYTISVLRPLLRLLRALHAATASNHQQGNSLSKRILQHTATPSNSYRRIVALEKVAGSSPIGHPPICR